MSQESLPQKLDRWYSDSPQRIWLHMAFVTAAMVFVLMLVL
jgi:hypothetical protein